MNKIKIEDILFKVAKEFIEKRFPTGWGDVAVMYSKNLYEYKKLISQICKRFYLCYDIYKLTEK